MKVSPILFPEPYSFPTKRFEGDHLPKVIVSGLYLAKNRLEKDFWRDVMIIWLNVEFASRAKI